MVARAVKPRVPVFRPATGALASLELELFHIEVELSKAAEKVARAGSSRHEPRRVPVPIWSDHRRDALLLQTWGELVESEEDSQAPAQRLVRALEGVTSQVEEGISRMGVDAEQAGVAALLVSVQLAFSVWYVLGKEALDGGCDPFAFALMREALSSAALWAAALKFEGGLRLQQPGDLRRFVILGALCCGNVAGFLKGLQYVPELQASIMQPLVPVLVMAASAGLGIQRISGRGKAGVILSSAGAVLATLASFSGSGGGGGGGETQLLGSGIMVAQVCAYAGMMVYQRGLASRYPPITLTAAYYSIACVMTGLLDVGAHHFDLSEITSTLGVFGAPLDVRLWGALGFAVVMATAYNYSAMTYASSKVPASTVSVYSALQPLFSLLIGIAMFHHELSPEEAASGALIIGGLLLATSDDGAQSITPTSATSAPTTTASAAAAIKR